MSMSHSAFVFDYERFETELRPTLLRALGEDNKLILSSWIEVNRSGLVDPYECKPLKADWEPSLSTRTVQEYGDFALTKFYECLQNIGLDDDWQELEELLEDLGASEAILLGTALQADNGALFDPGGCGSYFQTAREARSNLLVLEQLGSGDAQTRDRLVPVVTMLSSAVSANRGLYVTF